MEDAWKAPLTKVLSEYIPIVIGYGGGDQTLMSLLDQIHLRSIYWCLRNEKPSPRIEKILERNHGEWVPILGFDELLFQINERYPYENPPGDPGQYIKHVAEERRKKFNSSVDKVKERYTTVEKERISGISADTTGVAAAVMQYEERTERTLGPQPEVEGQIYAIRLELTRGHSQKALGLCTEALSKHPGEPRLYDLRSTAYHTLGYYAEALEDANQVIQLDPNKPEYYYGRGVTLHEMKRYEDALEDKNKAIQLDPENPRYYDQRGVTLHAMKRYEDALEDRNKAIQLDPKNPRYYEQRSTTLYAMKRYEDALEGDNKAVHLAPTNPDYYASRAITLRALGRTEEAQQDEEQARALRAGANH